MKTPEIRHSQNGSLPRPVVALLYYWEVEGGLEPLQTLSLARKHRIKGSKTKIGPFCVSIARRRPMISPQPPQ